MNTMTKPNSFENLFELFFENPVINKVAKLNPAMNAHETENEFLLELELPGYNKEDIEVSVENNQLVVSANHKEESEKSDKKWLRREIRSGHYERRITLPENSDLAKISAEAKNGILTINVPKNKIEDKVKKITVQG